jgi:two-component system sensor histidine kinase KdpD
VALITFGISALLVSRLSARARNERTKAEQRRVEMEKLCELSLKLLFLDKGPAYGPQIVDLIQRLFSCEIVTLFDSASLAIHEWSSDPETSLKTLTRVACVTGQEVEQPETDTWVRLLRFHGRVIGALALRGKELSATATNALASLSSICMERARSFESESRAAAERRAEELRNAVLDALAHEFKTPLTVISTASNGLLAMDGLLALQRDKLSNVDHEAKWLNEMTTHVLRASRLEVEIARQLEQNSAAKTETANKSVGA